MAKYQGSSFKQYQSVMATTDWVAGECYWELSATEKAYASEYVDAPRSINVDQTEREATVTLGQMLTRDEVAKAFGVKAPLPYPQGVAPAQKNPWSERSSSAWKWSGIWAGVLLAVFVALTALSPSGRYLSTTVHIPDGAKPGSPEAMVFSEPFEIPVKTPLEVEVACPELSNSWSLVIAAYSCAPASEPEIWAYTGFARILFTAAGSLAWRVTISSNAIF